MTALSERDKKIITRLVEAMRKDYEWRHRVEEAWGPGGTNLFDKPDCHTINYLDDLICDLAGIPQEETVETEHGSEGFCRDYWTDLLYEVVKGEEAIERLIRDLESYGSE